MSEREKIKNEIIMSNREKTKNEIRAIIKKQKWTDEMVGVLAGEFIAENNLSSKFLEYLKTEGMSV